MSAESLQRLLSRKWFILAVSLGLFVTCAALFARSQEIWVDETTQLSGLSLDPVSVVRWLAGEDRGRFGVPGDRMPPLSYWLGWTWSQVAGLSENSLRALGILSVSVALVLIVETAWNAFGSAAAWVSGLWFGLAPTVLTLGPEIRAYPFLVLGSAVTCFGLHRLATLPAERVWPALLTIGGASLASAYCHFFGIVLFGAAFVAATYIVVRRRLPIRGLFGMLGGFSIGAAGLVPFLLSAIEMSRGGQHESASVAGIAQSTARLTYRVFGGHPALNIVPGLAVVAVCAAIFCVIASAVYLLPRHVLFGACCAALVAGLGAVAAAQFVLKGFDAASISYNSWMLPYAALLVGGSVSAQTRVWATRAARGLAAAATAALAIGALLLVGHAPAYAHGAPERVTARLVSVAEPETLAVLHEEGGSWAFMYFPLHYEFARLPQYLVAPVTDGKLLLKRIQREGTPDASFSELSGRKVVLLSTQLQRFGELAAYVKNGHTGTFTSPDLRAALANVGCRVTANEVFMAFMGTELSWLECK